MVKESSISIPTTASTTDALIKVAVDSNKDDILAIIQDQLSSGIEQQMSAAHAARASREKQLETARVNLAKEITTLAEKTFAGVVKAVQGLESLLGGRELKPEYTGSVVSDSKEVKVTLSLGVLRQTDTAEESDYLELAVTKSKLLKITPAIRELVAEISKLRTEIEVLGNNILELRSQSTQIPSHMIKAKASLARMSLERRGSDGREVLKCLEQIVDAARFEFAKRIKALPK